jgi:hypothetical protein
MVESMLDTAIGDVRRARPQQQGREPTFASHQLRASTEEQNSDIAMAMPVYSRSAFSFLVSYTIRNSTLHDSSRVYSSQIRFSIYASRVAIMSNLSSLLSSHHAIALKVKRCNHSSSSTASLMSSMSPKMLPTMYDARLAAVLVTISTYAT